MYNSRSSVVYTANIIESKKDDELIQQIVIPEQLYAYWLEITLKDEINELYYIEVGDYKFITTGTKVDNVNYALLNSDLNEVEPKVLQKLDVIHVDDTTNHVNLPNNIHANDPTINLAVEIALFDPVTKICSICFVEGLDVCK